MYCEKGEWNDKNATTLAYAVHLEKCYAKDCGTAYTVENQLPERGLYVENHTMDKTEVCGVGFPWGATIQPYRYMGRKVRSADLHTVKTLSGWSNWWLAEYTVVVQITYENTTSKHVQSEGGP